MRTLFTALVLVLVASLVVPPLARAQTPPVTQFGIGSFPLVVDTTPSPEPATLDTYVLSHAPKSYSIPSTLRYVIGRAVAGGVSANVIVFLLLFPLIASMVAFTRHVIGLSGFSIYAPAALAVVLLRTGIASGILLFIGMIGIAIIGKQFIKLLKLEYVPRTALLLWFVSLGVMIGIFVSTAFNVDLFKHVDIFPLLLLVLLSEDFMGMQSDLPIKVVLERSMTMMVLATIGAVCMGTAAVQQLALSYPEILLASIAVIDFLIGKYVGLRLSEYFRFKPIIDAEE